MSAENASPTSHQAERKYTLNRRLEGVCWGLFLIMMGGLWLAPEKQIPRGTWLIGAGVIMLGLNAVRAIIGIKMSGFTIVLGVLALGSGLSSLLSVRLPIFPVLIVVAGAAIVFKALSRKPRDPGSAGGPPSA